jgi:hypothetical protein
VSKEKKEHVSAIEAAKGLCDQYTRSDVLKLKGKPRRGQCGRGTDELYRGIRFVTVVASVEGRKNLPEGDGTGVRGPGHTDTEMRRRGARSHQCNGRVDVERGCQDEVSVGIDAESLCSVSERGLQIAFGGVLHPAQSECLAPFART